MSVDGENSPGRMPWWLWPTALCILAPLSAWSWQALFAEVTNVRLSTSVHTALPLTVWVIALGDRLLEASRRRATWRHRFIRNHRPYFMGALLVGLIILARLIFWSLSTTIMEFGIFLAVAVLFYLFFARVEIGPKVALPREIVRGGVYSAGVLLPTFGMASVPPAALQLMIAQTLLVSLVLLSIACHEHQNLPQEKPHQQDWQSIEARIGVWLFLLLGTVIWLAYVESKQPSSNMVRYYIIMGLVVVVAFGIYVMRKRLSIDALHALSWAALSLPAVVLLF